MGSSQQEQRTTPSSRSCLTRSTLPTSMPRYRAVQQAAQPMRGLDAKAKSIGITPHQRSPCSIKTPGESHAKGGKARTGDAARPVPPAVQGRAAGTGMTWRVRLALRKINEPVARSTLATADMRSSANENLNWHQRRRLLCRYDLVPCPTCASVSSTAFPVTAQQQPRGAGRRTFGQHPVEGLEHRLLNRVVELHEGAAARHSVVSRPVPLTSTRRSGSLRCAEGEVR